MHDIERELVEATGYEVKRKFANRQDYLGSILNAVLKLSNEDFDELTDEAAAWANAAVEAKNARSQELPDFDEVEPDDGEGDDAADDESDSAGGEPDGTDIDPEAQPEAVEVAPTKAKKAPKPKKTEPELDEEDVVLDKWGSMEGSKNSQALAMFEKGATTKEVKDAIGGTYYNILKKAVEKGHKLEKEGSLLKLTHSSDLGTKPKKKGK